MVVTPTFPDVLPTRRLKVQVFLLLDPSTCSAERHGTACYMLEAQISNTRKRQSPECPSPQHVSKRQKCNYPRGFCLPPVFWDNLSKIHLTKGALDELDRRYTNFVHDFRQPYQRSQHRITRSDFAKSKKSSQPWTPAVGYLHHCGTRTLNSLRRTARLGGPDITNLRGFRVPLPSPNAAMSLKRSNSRIPKRSLASTPDTQSSTNTSRSTGPYNRNFQQNLVDHGVYPEGYEYPDGRLPPQPHNWEEINRRLSEPRPSLSPSRFKDEDFRKFKRADTHAVKEKQVTTSVIPIIEGDVGDSRCVSGGIPFTNLDHLTNGTLVPGNPDVYYGARPEQLDRQVRDELSGYIVPSTQDELPLAPNFFLAAKGPDGSLAVASKQASYDGALGARGMHSLQSYGATETFIGNNASTITSIYHGGQLKMFTVHAQHNGPGIRQEYHMHQLKGWSMTSDPETFRRGAAAYRNARDWAKEQRDEAIRRANEKAREHQAEMSPVHTSEATVNDRSRISQESPNTENYTSNTTVDLTEPSSGDEGALHERLIKRSNRHSLQSSPLQRKRHHAGVSIFHSQESELESSEHSGLSQEFENQALESGPDLQPTDTDKSKTPDKAVPSRKDT